MSVILVSLLMSVSAPSQSPDLDTDDSVVTDDADDTADEAEATDPAPPAQPPVAAVAVGTGVALVGMGMLGVALPLMMGGAVLLAGSLVGGPVWAIPGGILLAAGAGLGATALAVGVVSLGLDLSGLTRTDDLALGHLSSGAPLPVRPWEHALVLRDDDAERPAARARVAAWGALTAFAGMALVGLYTLVTTEVVVCITVMVVAMAVLAAVGVGALLVGGGGSGSLSGCGQGCGSSNCGSGGCGSSSPARVDRRHPVAVTAAARAPVAVPTLVPGFTLPWAVGWRLAARGFQGMHDAFSE